MEKWKINNSTTIWLFTVKEFEMLPDGTELLSILGDKKIKGKHRIDMDTRFNHIAYGVKNIEGHPLEKLFMEFLLKK